MKLIHAATALVLLSATVIPCGAAIVWDGPAITFSKTGGADWTLPQNQDRITDDVWLTRADTSGLFNVKLEPAFTHNSSPAGTEWAYGTTASFASLTYKNWEAWNGGAGGGPPSTVGRDAVLHLISEDIYIDIRFTNWGGSASSGAFSYVRSTAPVPEPASVALLGLGAFLLSSRRRCFGRADAVPR